MRAVLGLALVLLVLPAGGSGAAVRSVTTPGVIEALALDGREVAYADGRSARDCDRVRIWNLQTDAGDLDITFEPSGTHGYDDLRRDAVSMRLRSGSVTVASLADVIRSKEAADRPRDRAALPGLRALLSLHGK